MGNESGAWAKSPRKWQALVCSVWPLSMRHSCYTQSTRGLGGLQSSKSICTGCWEIKFIKRGRGTFWHPFSLPASLCCSDALLQSIGCLSHLLLNALSACSSCRLPVRSLKSKNFWFICLTSRCLEVVPWAHAQHCSHMTSTGYSIVYGAGQGNEVCSVALAHLFKQAMKQGDLLSTISAHCCSD